MPLLSCNVRCDLHVHSIHSGMCTVPLLKKICRESYTDPQHLYVIGTLHGVAPSCPGTLGPFSFQVTKSDVHLGYDTQRGVVADMAATVTVKAPGPNTIDSISATGSLSVDLWVSSMASETDAGRPCPAQWDAC